jgi:hypothetical protein
MPFWHRVPKYEIFTNTRDGYQQLATLIFAIQSSAAQETKIRSTNHHHHDLLAADVAATKSTHDGVCSEPSIKGQLLCGFMCQGMLQAMQMLFVGFAG